MLHAIKQTIAIRQHLLKLTLELSDEQMLIIPEHSNNNILWNLAHVVVSQQILQYKLSKLPLLVSETMLNENRKGTNPKDWSSIPNRSEVENLMTSLGKQLESDYKEKRFTTFTPYLTSVGVELTNIDDAISFNLFHEGIHVGSVFALVRAIKASASASV